MAGYDDLGPQRAFLRVWLSGGRRRGDTDERLAVARLRSVYVSTMA